MTAPGAFAAPSPPADPTAVLGRRTIAALIDAAIGLLLFPLALLVGTYTFYERVPTATPGLTAICDAEVVGDTADILCLESGDDTYIVDLSEVQGSFVKLQLVATAIGMVNPVLLQGLTGASVGKFALGLRVVRPDGSIAGFWRQVVRWLAWLVEGGLIALILVLVTDGHRRLGDVLATTYVVGTSSVGRPIELPLKLSVGPPPPAWSPDGPHWDPARGTYILFDRSLQEWRQWDEGSHSWLAISR